MVFAVQDILIFKTDYFKSYSLQQFCAHFIVLRLIVMDGPIYFHNQSIFQADKIANKIFNGMLPAKFHPIHLLIPQ